MHQLCEHIRRWLALSAQAVAVAAAVAQEPAAPAPLTNCAAVKALPREAAVQRLPVRITGVVSYREALRYNSNSAFVLHDGAEGVYCTLSPESQQAARRPASGREDRGRRRQRPGLHLAR